jgi:hypothetical protein
MNPNTLHVDLARRATITELVGVYRKSAERVRAAYDELQAAQDELRATYGDPEHTRYYFDTIDHYDRGNPKDRAPRVLGRLTCHAWTALVERVGLRRLLSIAAAKQLDAQLQDPAALPELTVENVLTWLEATAAAAPTHTADAIREVFDWLRPHHQHYKTNSPFEIGPRVVISWYVVERKWNGRGFNVGYRSRDRIRALDNVFHQLDGQGAHKGYSSALEEAIQASPDGKGATPYFEFRCYRNGNLHLRFLRLDLLAQLNKLAGGHNLKPSNP